ncbi:MAG TPA: hypothetical protein VK629_05705 [Steroidobacteraceae bacterium]|nr:hypothetical protein [Steroidobacteraceae bacterium]
MPNREQIIAVAQYARANGRYWKSKLLNDWANGNTEGLLQQVRNDFGPRWLKAFKLIQL